MSYFKNRQVWSWALYDFANSAYATAVMAGLFPIFYKSFWSQGVEVTESTFYLGLVNSLSSLVIVLLAPFMGALADRAGRRKRLLVMSAFFGCLNTAVLSLIPAGEWQWAFFIYLFATVGFTSSVIFSDALLTQVSEPEQFTKVSSLGYGMGYLGGGLLFLLNVLMITEYQYFGFRSMDSATQWAFFSVAIWWGLFTLPVLLWVPDTIKQHQGMADLILGSVKQVLITLSHVRAHKPVFLFLLSYWFYIDAVDTIVRMAVDYGLSLGLQSTDLIRALLITQFVGFPAAIVYGYLGHRYGIKRALLAGLVVYLLVILWAYRIQSASDFYILAVIVGLVQGGVQALSRAFFARLIPLKQAGEFFGFYNIIGKFSVIIGPVLMGAVAWISGDNRLSILTIAVLLLIGMVLLFKVSDNTRQ